MKITQGKNNISYVSDNFKEWFGDMVFIEHEKSTPLLAKTLERYMTDSEILRELKPEKVSLADMYETLKNMSHDTWAIFYIEDTSNVLRSVLVRWFGGGWGVDAYSVLGPDEWNAGGQVFSRNFFDTVSSDPLSPIPSDTLPKELIINGVTYIRQ